jgi:hypothetical protein
LARVLVAGCCVALVAPLAPPTLLPAQQPAPGTPFKLTGYAEASYAYTTRPVRDTIVGHLFDRLSDQFVLNALSLSIQRPVATDRWDGGARIDVLVGQNAPMLQSSGFNLGPNGDITQLHVLLNVPTGNGRGVQIKLGKLATLMGLELIETIDNPNWSAGHQFIYVENFTATGAEVAYRPSQGTEVQLRVSNGWDRVVGGRKKDVMARVAVSPGQHTSVGLVGYYGPQQESSAAKRYGLDLLVQRRLGGASLWLQADYGAEEANPALPDPTRDAHWWAGGLWLAFDAAPRLGVALRADYLDDRQGFRTSAAFGLPAGGPRHTVWSATATLNVRTWPNALVRPELRYDRSNLTPFDGRSQQVVAGLAVAYVFGRP